MWFTAVAQMIGQESAAQPLNVANPYAAQQQSSSMGSMLLIGGLVVLVGGAAYYMLRAPPRAMGRRSRR